MTTKPIVNFTSRIYHAMNKRLTYYLLILSIYFCWLLEKLTIAPPTHPSRAPALDLFKAHLVFFRNAAKALGTICHIGFSSHFPAAAADVFIGCFGSSVLKEALHTLYSWPRSESHKPHCVHHVIKGQESFKRSRPPELNVVSYKLWSVSSKSQGT